MLPTDPVLQCRGLRKSYRQRQVLGGLDLNLAAGELLGLIGPNGAGKSTLFRCLIGLVDRDAGELSVLGADPRYQALLVRQQCCYLPGETGLYAQMTGRQFLDFALGFHRKQQPDLQQQLLANFQLPLQQRIRSYSAGMKQKLALCAALIPDVPLYLLDEPDRALDASVRYFLRDVLRELQRRGKTILLSSHHLGEVETLATRLEFLLDGQLVPKERVAAARAQLRRRARLRLDGELVLPAGVRLLQREPDGNLLLESEREPLQWLAELPASAVQSAELGTLRLEDLYQLLLPEQSATRQGEAR